MSIKHIINSHAEHRVKARIKLQETPPTSSKEDYSLILITRSLFFILPFVSNHLLALDTPIRAFVCRYFKSFLESRNANRSSNRDTIIPRKFWGTCHSNCCRARFLSRSSSVIDFSICVSRTLNYRKYIFRPTSQNKNAPI